MCIGRKYVAPVWQTQKQHPVGFLDRLRAQEDKFRHIFHHTPGVAGCQLQILNDFIGGQRGVHFAIGQPGYPLISPCLTKQSASGIRLCFGDHQLYNFGLGGQG